MSFVNILRRVGLIAGTAAPQVIAAVNPAMGALAGTVVQAVLLAEARQGAGNGASKKDQAMASVQVALPLLLSVFEASAGRQLADQEMLTNGVDKLNDGVVDVLNAFRVLPKS